MFDFALDLERMKYVEWDNVKELNAAASTVNPKAVALVEKYKCDYVWSSTEYVAGD